MNDHKKPVSGAEATTNPIPSQGRRRLVKGAMLATPAVMTLMSGRLMAATSLTCVAKGGVPGPGWVDEDGNVLVYKDPQNSDYTLGYYKSDGQGGSVFVSSSPAAPSTSCLSSINPNG